MLLNRPAIRNPLSDALTDAMMTVLDDAERDDDLRALVLTAAGPVFCAGAELGTLLHPDGVDRRPSFVRCVDTRGSWNASTTTTCPSLPQ